MAGKSYIKTGYYTWSKIKKMYLKTGATTWTAVRKAYLKTGAATWKKVFDTSSNRPFIENNDYPKIRLNTFRSTSSSGVQPPVAAPPVQFIGPRSGGIKGASTPSPTTGFAGGDGIAQHADLGDLHFHPVARFHKGTGGGAAAGNGAGADQVAADNNVSSKINLLR